MNKQKPNINIAAAKTLQQNDNDFSFLLKQTNREHDNATININYFLLEFIKI